MSQLQSRYCAGSHGYADSEKLSVYSAISRLVHEHDFLPIELVRYILTGISGADDVSHAYTDASWSARHREYDVMSPEDVRATARAARQHRQQHVHEDDICRALVIIAAEGTGARGRLEESLLQAAQRTRKRRMDALEAEEVPEGGNAGTHDAVAENCAPDQAHEPVDNEFLDFFGV
jgi:hypothetical protein